MAAIYDEPNSLNDMTMDMTSSSQTSPGLFDQPPTIGGVGEQTWSMPIATGGLELTTPRKSPPRHDPFGSSHNTHLPTPQSPGTAGSYVAGRAYLPESPMPQSFHERLPAPQFMPHRSLSRVEEHVAASQSFITPDSSPFLPRRDLQLPNGMAPAALDSASILSSPFAIGSNIQIEGKESVASASSTGQHTPPSSREMTPYTTLSSPPLGRLTLADQSMPKSHAVSTSSTTSSNALLSTPGCGDDLFSPDSSSPKSPPLLSAPIPQRAIGGEVQRMRLQLATDQVARSYEKEARRPDYLVRRPRSPHDQPNGDSLDADDQVPGFGVTVSPVKGRRIQLFQETSEETFEQSLLAGGYPGYGSTVVPDPQTPISKGANGLSQRALQWLQQATPGQPGPSSLTSEPDTESVPSEKELLKRKRLAAFQHKETSAPPSKMLAVEMEGRGRVLVPPEETPAQQESPKKRSSRRKKRRGDHAKRGLLDLRLEEREIKGPNWLDSAFPWCMRLQERDEMTRMEEEERLKCIERYLERDSDSDSEEEDVVEDQSLQPVVRSHDDDVLPPLMKKGRGKVVPLKSNLHVRDPYTERGSVVIPSDPADARAALLSKRSVRALAARRRREKAAAEEGEDDEAVLCPCRRGDDGRPLVQCDDCHTWYHLQCVGIKSAEELGEEDDPWYCSACLGVELAALAHTEPTFVPTDERPAMDGIRDPLLYQGALQGSPKTPWSSSRRPKTPSRSRDSTSTYHSRTSWGGRTGGPSSTPNTSAHSARVYTTPGHQFDSPFDPNNTPSRSKHASYTTPKGGIWSGRNGGPLRTASDAWRLSGGTLTLSNFDRYNNLPPNSPYRSIYSHDDTPIRRAAPREQPRPLLYRSLWDSPGGSRFTRGALRGDGMVVDEDERALRNAPMMVQEHDCTSSQHLNPCRRRDLRRVEFLDLF
ncbi:uncharacterized protein LAESUDRAFT_723229 [Laetiporus sulphureus 93-53]|uniref:PHD-type domain-containing protein n=1 Tax=Laetiporus sulphureus 93-53 TaxID=1314785 RepID=A0A165FGG2_9APHY|nr:uncharacterized protein LAESUDRAFT_723229 [Laetiporus sulphureus 93-53]KZT08933.1 hypothetical protein LAESUDRAFT_723229 [Laetiporus sulphureus 93-53]